MSGTLPLSLLTSNDIQQQEPNEIIKEEIDLNIIQPLKFIMDLDNSSDNSDPTNTPFTVNQQMQVYLHALSSKKFQHTNGNILFALYADFLEKQYHFNINDPEINALSYLLRKDNYQDANTSKPIILDTIIKRTTLNCIEQSIDSLALDKQNTEKFHSIINQYLRTENFNLYNFTRKLFIDNILRTKHISQINENQIDTAKKFTTNLNELFKKNKISINTKKTDTWNPEYGCLERKHTYSFNIEKPHLTQLTKEIIFEEIISLSQNSIEIAHINLKSAKQDLNHNLKIFCKTTQEHKPKATKFWLTSVNKENLGNDACLKVYNYLTRLSNKNSSCLSRCMPCLTMQSAQNTQRLESQLIPSENDIAQDLSLNAVSL